MKNKFKKIAFVISLILVSSFTTNSFAEIENKSICEFSIYDGELGVRKVINSISATFVQEAFNIENSSFENLDKVVDEINDPNCKLQDGRPALNFLLQGFGDAFRNINDWDLLLQKIQILKKAKPNETYPIIAEAKYWRDYAWLARGKGYASTVTPEGWKLFNQRLTKAESVLINNKEIGSKMPVWYELMVEVELGLNRSKEEQDKYFMEGIKRYKDFFPLYINKRNFLEPRWGGSWKDVDNFINWSANNFKDTKGMAVYSLLYLGVFSNSQEQAGFFENTLVKWPKLKQGFEDLIKMYPQSQMNLNLYASMACLAGDKDSYFSVRSKLEQPIKWSWVHSYSVNDCDSKYGFKI